MLYLANKFGATPIPYVKLVQMLGRNFYHKLKVTDSSSWHVFVSLCMKLFFPSLKTHHRYFAQL